MTVYIPALRHGTNEQQVMQKVKSELSSSGNSWADPTLIKPLLEIVSENDISSVTPYTDTYDEVLVDFPRYLTTKENKHQSEVKQLVSKHGGDPVSFFNCFNIKEFTPVLSGESISFDYSVYRSHLKRLQSEFSRVGARLFIPVSEYSKNDKISVKDITDALREKDFLLLDIPDIRNLDKGIRENLEYISNKSPNTETYVFDLFKPRDSINYNYSLVMSKYLEADGFGDFCLEPRFPQDIPGPAFANTSRKIRQYKNNSHSVSTYDGPDHYVLAVENMLKRNTLDKDHCPFCEELVSRYNKVKNSSERTDLDNSFVKRARMGHYQFSLLKDEITRLDSVSNAKDFDKSGLDDII